MSFCDLKCYIIALFSIRLKFLSQCIQSNYHSTIVSLPFKSSFFPFAKTMNFDQRTKFLIGAYLGITNIERGPESENRNIFKWKFYETKSLIRTASHSAKCASSHLPLICVLYPLPAVTNFTMTKLYTPLASKILRVFL